MIGKFYSIYCRGDCEVSAGREPAFLTHPSTWRAVYGPIPMRGRRASSVTTYHSVLVRLFGDTFLFGLSRIGNKLFTFMLRKCRRIGLSACNHARFHRHGGPRMSHHQGIFCISIDAQSDDLESAQLAERNQDLQQLIRRSELPANWTTQVAPKSSVPQGREITLVIPHQLERSELVTLLRRTNAALARDRQHIRSVVLDPHEAVGCWDVLVREGCQVIRPRVMSATSDSSARVFRGGLWMAPMSCSFVGGSRRSVRSLFSVCQRQLVSTTRGRGVFHLNVDIGNPRNSWKEELEALRALLQTAKDLQNKSRLVCVKLSELPICLSRRATTPMRSVLSRAA